MTKKTFKDFGVDTPLCDALEQDGITDPFPIQELTLPVALEGHDVIGQARTGSGKTLGFGLPLLQNLDLGRREVQALVVTPTRELCLQVSGDLEQSARNLDVEVLSIYGGVPIDPQRDALKRGVHVVVGTPGRLLDHVRRGNLDLSTATTLVLDEADEMLDMGFLPDVEQLISKCAEERHTMLFSATMPTAVVNLARRYMDRPTFIRAEVEEHTLPDNMEQHFFVVHKLDKPRILARILQTPKRGLCVVFTRTKAMADRLVDDLRGYDIDAVAIHGDLRQATRERNLGKFRSETDRHDVLVATEVAARGLDIDSLTHVINYDCPEDEKMYLHRIGRTARAGGSGVAITFASFAEMDRLNVIRKALDLAEKPMMEVFSTSDELQELFDLPDQTPWEHLGRSRKGSGSKGQGGGNGKSGSGRAKKDAGSANKGGANKGGANKAKKDGADKDAGGRERRSGDGRPAAAKAEAAPARTSATDEDPVRSRTRTRTRTSGGSGDGKPDGSRTSGSSGGRSRARAARTKDGDKGSSGSDEPRNDKPRNDKQRNDKPRTDTSGSDRPRPDGDEQRGEPEPAACGRDRRGDDTRGGGRPLLDRRVKVDHLP